METKKQGVKRESARRARLERQDRLDRTREGERRKEVKRQDALDWQRMADRWVDQDWLDKAYGEE